MRTKISQYTRIHITRVVLTCIVGIGIYSLAAHFGWFNQLERKIYDLGINLVEPSSIESDCVVVAIDSATATYWNPPVFPLSRHLNTHAELVAALTADGARLICFDVLFDRLDSSENDQMSSFGAACASSGRVLLASVIENEPNTRKNRVALRRLSLPDPMLSKCAAGIGLANSPLDSDGKIRSAFTAIRFGDSLISSFPVEAVSLAGLPVPRKVQHDETFLIDYSWIPRIPVVSYRDVLERPASKALIKGKLCFVGSMVDGSSDLMHTPLNSRLGRHSTEFGVVIHAAAAQTLIAGRHIYGSSRLFNLAVMILLGMVFTTLISGKRVLIGVSVFALVAASFIILSVLAVRYFSVTLPGGKILFGFATQVATLLTLDVWSLSKITSFQGSIITDFKEDMKSAKLIQEHLQPSSPPQGSGFEIAVRQITCKEVGGDYYDFFSLDNNKIGLLIGDVAGKGVSASLIMSNVQAIVRTEAPKQASPAALLSTINGKLNSLSLASTRFMTLFYGIFDPVNRRLVYANAGHCYPIIFGRAGGYEMVTEGGTFLGPFASMHWTDHEVELSEEDLICLYTDGVSEACIDVSDQFGEEGIISCLKHRVMGAEAALDELLGKCTLFVRNRPFGDDWTAIVLKLKRPNRGSI